MEDKCKVEIYRTWCSVCDKFLNLCNKEIKIQDVIMKNMINGIVKIVLNIWIGLFYMMMLK